MKVVSDRVLSFMCAGFVALLLVVGIVVASVAR